MSVCVTLPAIGTVNETYIRRHANDLVIGGASVIANVSLPQNAQTWMATGPSLILSGSATSFTDIERENVIDFWRMHRVSAVLAQYLHHSLRYISLAREMNISIFPHTHGRDCSEFLHSQIWRERYRELADATGIIVVSEVMKARLIEIGIPACMIHRIPYGVDSMGFTPRTDRGTKVRFLAVGRFTGKKGPIFLLESFRRALMVCPSIELHLVGQGELIEAVDQFITIFSLESHIVFHGTLAPPQIQGLIAECDVFVQHSVTSAAGDEEGLPVSILEAMAGGLPVISTIHAGIPEAVVADITGLLVPERDVDGMANCMSRLANNYWLRTNFGQAGAERASLEFSWAREKNRLEKTLGLNAAGHGP